MRTSAAAVLSILQVGTACLLLSSCQDTGQSPPSRPEPPRDQDPGGSMLALPLDLVYVCGNRFLVTNATRSPVEVTYRVAGTEESGSLTLREGPDEDPGYSETELETSRRGAVELYQDDQMVARRRNEGSACAHQPSLLRQQLWAPLYPGAGVRPFRGRASPFT